MPYYFESFPKISYNNIQAIDITRRAIVEANIIKDQSAFYPYTLSDGETADSLAYDYYGDANYVWIIYFVNNIVDPYYDWPLSSIDFDQFIAGKYGSVTTAQSTNLYYKQIPQTYYLDTISNSFINSNNFVQGINSWQPVTIDNNLKINYDPNLPGPDPTKWTLVTAYDDEYQKNEDKKNIILLSSVYSSYVMNQLSSILNA